MRLTHVGTGAGQSEHRDASGCNAQNLSMIAWSLAALEVADWPLLEAISAGAILPNIEFSPQACANTAWSFAVLPMPDRPLLYSISAKAMLRLSQCEPQNLSNMAWSLATLRCCNKPLLTAIAAQARGTFRGG